MTMSFTDEIKSYSTDDLELIIATQKDLYTHEEMVQLKQQLKNKRMEEIEARKAEAKEKEKRILINLPDTITCQKCGGPNSFDNIVCNYCGVNLDKRPFYIDPTDLEDDTQNEQLKTENCANDGYTFHYVISFLIPLIGFIVGAIMLAKDEDEQRGCGKTCILLAIASILLGIVIPFLLFQ